MKSFASTSSHKSGRVNSLQSDQGLAKGLFDSRKSEVDVRKRRATKRQKRRENQTETCNVGCSFGPFGGGSNTNNIAQMALAEKKNDKKKTDKKKEKESAKQKQKLLQKTQLVKDTMLNKKD